MKRTLTIFIIIILGIFTISYAMEQKWCPLCGMNLRMFIKTNHRLTLKDGKSIIFCSFHCSATYYSKNIETISKWEVMEYMDKEFIDAKEAYFLIGSDLPGTMTSVSKLAFKNKSRAKKYMKKHGGKIVTFNRALKFALQDLGEDMKIIKKKVAMLSKKGAHYVQTRECLNCHEKHAPSFDSPEFIETTPTRAKAKQIIMDGKNGMPSFKGKIDEKELHAIVLYIWSQRPMK